MYSVYLNAAVSHVATVPSYGEAQKLQGFLCSLPSTTSTFIARDNRTKTAETAVEAALWFDPMYAADVAAKDDWLKANSGDMITL